MEGDTLSTRYLRSRKRGRASPTKASDGRQGTSGLLRPRKTLGACGDAEEEEMMERNGRGTRRSSRRRRRRYASGVESAEMRGRSSSPTKESVNSCDLKRTASDTSSSGENSGSVETVRAPRRAELARFDAGDPRQIAEAKAVLSPCASVPSSKSSSGIFGIRDEEARAVLRAIGSGDKCYVCGLPGTGKTHTMARIATKLAEGANMQVVSVNCMHLARCGNPDDELVYDALIDAVENGRPGRIGSVASTTFAENTTSKSGGGSSAASASRSGGGIGGEVELRRILTRPPRRGHTISLDTDGNVAIDGQSRVRVRQRGEGVVVMLDEMDALDPRSLAPLLSLPCAVIGIANSITLIERLAASGATGAGAKPVTVAFAPYTQADLTRILDERLAILPFDLMHPTAVKLVTTRVAAHRYDIIRSLCPSCLVCAHVMMMMTRMCSRPYVYSYDGQSTTETLMCMCVCVRARFLSPSTYVHLQRRRAPSPRRGQCSNRCCSGLCGGTWSRCRYERRAEHRTYGKGIAFADGEPDGEGDCGAQHLPANCAMCGCAPRRECHSRRSLLVLPCALRVASACASHRVCGLLLRALDALRDVDAPRPQPRNWRLRDCRWRHEEARRSAERIWRRKARTRSTSR